MKQFSADGDGWYCGYWNGSPLQVKHSSGRPLKQDPSHQHDFAEYYFVVDGVLALQVGDDVVRLGRLELLMVEAGEKHRITGKSDDCSYLIIKEKSYPENKS